MSRLVYGKKILVMNGKLHCKDKGGGGGGGWYNNNNTFTYIIGCMQVWHSFKIHYINDICQYI